MTLSTETGTTMIATQTNTMHPFEKSGLGKAPFRFVGHERKVGPIQVGFMTIGAPGQPMGTCDHCGTGIADCYSVVSSDGNRFVVGSDCIEKLYGSKNRKSSDLARDPVYRAFKAEKNKIASARRHEREAVKIAAGKAWADQHEAELRAIPNIHRDGESRWDQYQWFMRCAGNKGKLDILDKLQQIVAKYASEAANNL